MSTENKNRPESGDDDPTWCEVCEEEHNQDDQITEEKGEGTEPSTRLWQLEIWTGQLAVLCLPSTELTLIDSFFIRVFITPGYRNTVKYYE